MKQIKDFLDKIIQDHVLDALSNFPDESIDCIITSPPYWGLRDYGEETKVIWDGEENCEHKWKEIIKPKERGSYGKNSWQRPGRDNEAKWEPQKSNFCQNCDAWYGQLGLEPTLDMYIEHLLQITAELKRVLKKTGIMFWNHGDSYGGSSCGKGDYRNINKRSISNPMLYTDKPNPQVKLKAKCMIMQNYRLIMRMIDEQGWILRNQVIWYKPNAMPASVKDRFSNTYEPVFMLVKNRKYWFDLDAVRIPCRTNEGRPPGVVRKRLFNYRVRDAEKKAKMCPQFKASQAEIERYKKQNKEYTNLGKNPGDLWTITTQPFPKAHFATFPEKLIEPMIKAGCPQWICEKCGKARVRITKNCGCNVGWRPGIVLDPFAGSGTTLVVARKLGRYFIGIELNPIFVEMAHHRLSVFPCRLEKFNFQLR